MMIRLLQGAAKKIIDEGTAAKFGMYGGSWKTELAKVIDPSELPGEYGGQKEKMLG